MTHSLCVRSRRGLSVELLSAFSVCLNADIWSDLLPLLRFSVFSITENAGDVELVALVDCRSLLLANSPVLPSLVLGMSVQTVEEWEASRERFMGDEEMEEVRQQLG